MMRAWVLLASVVGILRFDGAVSASYETRILAAAFGIQRREALSKAASAIVGGIALPVFAEESSTLPNNDSTLVAQAIESVAVMKKRQSSEFAAYSITPDASEALKPTLKPISVSFVLRKEDWI